MCGIFCSDNVSTFEVLGEANKERGNFSTGILFTNGKRHNILRIEGGANWDETKLPVEKGWLYLGHNLAPTETGRKWFEKTSHPFEYGDWIVAHNGVLTNHSELKGKFLPKHDCGVDSSIIPALLHENDSILGPPKGEIDEISNIVQTLELLEGTFALWIMNSRTKNLYIARQGSTLFYKGNNISSIKGKGYRQVKEGFLYKFSHNGLIKKDEFKTQSPFLTL
mgnify:FL=1|tara:strand:+ start:6373 stop:7041 length:669 start_codon:yes stop_codon:yes gene_type:complete